MHILFAGATGVVGRRIVPLLVANGHQVTSLTRNPGRAAAPRALGAEPVIADVVDRAALVAAVRSAAPDVVMHQLTDLAGADLAANARLRVVGTRNLVDAAHAAGVRRIVAQSIAFGHEDGPGRQPRTRRYDRTCVACPSWSPPWPSWRSGWCCATGCSTGPIPGTRRTG